MKSNPKTYTPFLRRFEEQLLDYMSSLPSEAERRTRANVIEEGPHIRERRRNSAVQVCFSAIEWTLGLDITDADYNDEALVKIRNAAIDHVCETNVSKYFD